MDTRTGEIKRFKEEEQIPDHFIKIHEEQMTEKQKKKMRVSKFDNKSKLGKIFTAKRKEAEGCNKRRTRRRKKRKTSRRKKR